MNRTSLISIVLAILQLVGSSIAIFACGGIAFMVFIFGGTADVNSAILLLLAKYLFFFVTAILVLIGKSWAIPLACLAGAIGVASEIDNALRFGFRQPAAAYLVFHAIYLAWFTILLMKGIMGRSTTNGCT